MPNAQHPVKPPHNPPAPRRPRPMREQLQQAVNTHIVDTAGRAFNDIDKAAERSKQSLKGRGVHGFDEIVDTGATLLKQLLARGLSK